MPVFYIFQNIGPDLDQIFPLRLQPYCFSAYFWWIISGDQNNFNNLNSDPVVVERLKIAISGSNVRQKGTSMGHIQNFLQDTRMFS